LAEEIVPVAGLVEDAYPRWIDARTASRMPVRAGAPAGEGDRAYSMSALAISTKADGAALVVLASETACRRLGITPSLRWIGHLSTGSDPGMPLKAAMRAFSQAMTKFAVKPASDLASVELHDAFSTQGLAFAHGIDIDPVRINRLGGGIARGHPIGAAGAVALVRVLSDLRRTAGWRAMGVAAIAAAGGLGTAALVGAR
jgi:acetyl-CoA C-acetyltransferase